LLEFHNEEATKIYVIARIKILYIERAYLYFMHTFEIPYVRIIKYHTHYL